MNYEEFKSKFEDHILGRAVNERAQESEEEEVEAPQPGSRVGGDLKSQ